MIAIIWRYEVRDAHRAEFESIYGSEGDWARLFARTDGFLGTELMRAEDGAYATVDRWRAREDFDAFLAEHLGDYQALDQVTESWTTSEEKVGLFEVVA